MKVAAVAVVVVVVVVAVVLFVVCGDCDGGVGVSIDCGIEKRN